ncbi:hypothetical protein [Petroclostridium sp. X23]|uniref:hypothetical protein n=1 Tax=Petroclostridium sp. X23 TaxID=3045146 RepID=UPI0024AD4F5C|nr:hypothetical protein [Petroclostridium sp. X23]WHH60338.1 hypothetical protein QKW49_06270 [Petroclostridium sp. X23]
MKLKEMLKENGVLETLDKIGFDSETVISGLTEETDAHYMKYRWFNTGSSAHAIPTEEMLEAGYPWEEWYKDRMGVLQHHILYLEKTDLCDMTFDCPITDTTHPEPTRNHFWYLYNDEDSRLLYTRK